MIYNKEKSFLQNLASTLFLLFFLVSCEQGGKQETKAFDSSTTFQWEYATPESQGMSAQKLDSLKTDLAGRGTKKLLIIKNDKIIFEWFAKGWEDSVRGHYTASLAKAITGGMSLLTAVNDGYIGLDDAASSYIPSWIKSGNKSFITIRHLATHTSGMEDAEATVEENKEIVSKKLDRHFDLPGWKGQFWKQDPNPFLISRDHAPVVFTPGVKYNYSNPGIAMLTYAVTASLKDSPYSDVRTYLKKRVYEPIGIDEKEYNIGYGKTFSEEGLQLVPSWGGGTFTAKAVARIGLLMLHKGNWMGKQIIDSSAVEKVTRYWSTALPGTSVSADKNSRSKKNPIPATTAGWYSNFDGVWGQVPRDAFAGGGAGNQHLLVISGMKMVIVRMGDTLYDETAGEGFWLGAEKYLFNPVMDAVDEIPYPQSDLSIEFAPEDSVIRLAEGSDCWPLTWADDDDMYTAYGDGWGFTPFIDTKLSLGLAKVSGNPPSIEGINLRSASGEKVGQGVFGAKASGMLMVEGTIYMLVRNMQNSVLMWSDDHGKSWEQPDWKFDISFGYPTFLNYGKNYEGSKDKYVYIYSHDEADAYKNSDHFILARVPKDQLKNWRKYEYFSGLNEGDKPKWSEDIRKREPVFSNPGRCYRSSITYNKGLKKYLWCQNMQRSQGSVFDGESKDIRFRGGIGIFESSNPWGPWRTVYYTRDWDMGPGETSSMPTKWMSSDGKTCHLVFSGDDYFSVREITFKN